MSFTVTRQLFALGLCCLIAACSGEDAAIAAASDSFEDPAEVELLNAGDVALSRIFQTPDDFFCDSGKCEGGLATDLGFNPVRPNELWMLVRQTYAGQGCDGKATGDNSGCNLLASRLALFPDAINDPGQVRTEDDGNAWHFLRLATALAFGDDDMFATVGEARTGNFTNERGDFMGPTLWSSDPTIFGVDFMRNGSHLDMLHGTPFGMGIAHERAHVYWAFNGQTGAVDRYDFKAPHEPGGEDHHDGSLARYATGLLARVENVPSHLEFATDRQSLLIADTGHGRVVSLDTRSGTEGKVIVTADDQLVGPVQFNDAVLTEVVPAGTITWPSGLAVRQSSFVVGDAANNTISEFTFEGKLLRRCETALSGMLAGLEFGPDGALYAVQNKPASLWRLEWPKK